MIDYVNTELISYTNDYDVPTFDEAYPLWKDGYISGGSGHYRNDLGSGVFHSWELKITDYYISETSDFYSIAEPRIYALCLRMYDTTTYSTEYIANSIGVCYYVISKSSLGDLNNEMYYLRLDTASIPSNIVSPFTNSNSVVGGEDVYFLYNLGSYIVSQSDIFNSILSFSIGNYTLFTLICTVGFTVYMSWAVFKWVIF